MGRMQIHKETFIYYTIVVKCNGWSDLLNSFEIHVNLLFGKASSRFTNARLTKWFILFSNKYDNI